MTHNGPNPAHNTDYSPLTPDRIATVLADEGLEYVLDTDATGRTRVRTGFINQSIVIEAGTQGVGAIATWRGRLAPEDAAKGLALVNEWNLHQIIPSVYMLESDTREIAFAARRTLGHTEPSTNQLGAFLVSTVDAFVALWDYFESSLPESVTWTAQDSS